MKWQLGYLGQQGLTLEVFLRLIRKVKQLY